LFKNEVQVCHGHVYTALPALLHAMSSTARACVWS
jgi:hypothetical protein